MVINFCPPFVRNSTMKRYEVLHQVKLINFGLSCRLFSFIFCVFVNEIVPLYRVSLSRLAPINPPGSEGSKGIWL